MNPLVFLGFVALLAAVPYAHAQTEPADQKSVDVTIDAEGSVSVVHHLRDSGGARTLELVRGSIHDMEFIDSVGVVTDVEIDSDATSAFIGPDDDAFFVRYDLRDALVLEDGVWTMQYRYLESTKFVLPDEVDLIFSNGRPILLEERKEFVCHGCPMLLEYSIDEPRITEKAVWEDREFDVEIRTQDGISGFRFDQPSKSISFDAASGGSHVTATVPLELLWGPYVVMSGEETLETHQYINNGTHVMVSFKPAAPGEVTMVGTTVIPEFPIIAPLAIGFLMVMLVPLARRLSLR